MRYVLWLAAHFELVRPACVCALRVYCCDSLLLVARLLLVLPGPVKLALEIGRFGCVLAEIRAMMCGLCGGSLAWLNAGVRGARLLLAVACGAQKCVCLIRAELIFGPVWTHEVILGVLDTPDICCL